jgi:PAS domain S-box-containing protein
MSIRKKTLFVICLTFLALLGVFFFTARWFLLQDAIDAEQRGTSQDVSRVKAALDDQVAVMDSNVGDWAPWDDTYEFIISADPAYITSNLPNETFANLGVELMLFLNNSGQVVFGKMVDLETDAEIPIPESIYSQVQVSSLLITHKDPSDKIAGILSLPEGPMVIASQPIVTSLGKGPIRGTLIMGRRLDATEITKLSQRTLLSVSAFNYNAAGLPVDVMSAKKYLVGGNPVFVAPQSEMVVSGYTIINDVYGNPSVILRVDNQRELYSLAKNRVGYLGLSLVVIGVMLGLIMIVLLDKMIVFRLTSLTSSVKSISKQGSPSSRIEVNGNDEIYELGTTVNSMLDSIENFRLKERESDERYRQLFDNSPVGIYRTTPNGRILVSNPAFAKMLGYSSSDELSTLNLETSNSVSGYTRKSFKEQIERDGKITGLELEWHKGDGTTIYIRENARLIRDTNGSALYYDGTTEDITERVRAEEEIRQLNTRLEQRVEERTRELRDTQEQLVRQEKLAVLGQLAGGVGHELRNPLGVINSAIYYLKLVQPDAPQKIKQYHSMIEQEVRNSEKIISDLLDFARIKSVDRIQTSVADLVAHTLDRFPVPESVKLVLDLPSDLPTVFADPRQMEQVLGNLTVNACQAMTSQSSEDGAPEPCQLTISARQLPMVPGDDPQSLGVQGLQNGMVAIAVTDTGTGITPENMKKIFEPLFTTKIKGIGLGLAVSRKLTEANKGRIDVHSEPGKGSTFTLVLPSREIKGNEL